MAQSTLIRPPSPQNNTTRPRTGSSAFASIATLARWQLRQTWKLLAVVGIGMLIATVLVGAIPLYLQITTSAGTQSILNSPPTNSYFTVHGFSGAFSSTALARAQRGITLQAQTDMGPYISPEPLLALEFPQFKIKGRIYLHMVGFPMQEVAAHATVAEGRLPARVSDTIEIALAPEMARTLQLKVGDTFTIPFAFSDFGTISIQYPVPFTFVGTFTPRQKDEAFWHGEDFTGVTTLDDGSTLSTALMSNDAVIAVLNRLAQKPELAQLFCTQYITLNWYFYFTTERIDASKIDDFVFRLSNALTHITGNFGQNPSVSQITAFGPLDGLEEYRSHLAVLRVPTMSLGYIIGGLVLFFVALVIDLLVERQEKAIALLRSRGASGRQIAGSLLTQIVTVALVILAVGPLLAVWLAQVLAHRTLSSADQKAIEQLTGNPVQAALGLGEPALITLSIAALAMGFSIWRSTRSNMLLLRREAARSTHRPLWARLRLDLVAAVLALVGSGFSLYLSGPGVFDARTHALILPTGRLVAVLCLLLASILLFLRFFPLLLRTISRLAMRNRGATPLLAVAQMARTPGQSIRMTLLFALTAAFAIFTLAFTTSQAQRLTDTVAFQAGADFSGVRPAFNTPTLQSLRGLSAQYRAVPGILSATFGYTSSVEAASATTNLPMELRAVDTNTFASTAIWTGQDSTQPLSTLMDQLAAQRTPMTQQNLVPVIVDDAARQALGLSIGSRFAISDNGQNKVNMIVIAEVSSIPTIDDSMSASGTADILPVGGLLVDIQNYAAVSAQVNSVGISPSQVWLRTTDNPTELAAIRQQLNTGGLQLNYLNDRRAIIASLHYDPLEAAITGILVIGALTALLLGIVGSLLMSWLSARTRLTNFVILRALGGTPKQIAAVLGWEAGLVYGMALAAGLLAGILLSELMVPAFVFTPFSQVSQNNTISPGLFYLIQSVPQVQTSIPPLAVAGLIAGLIVICGVALWLMINVVMRPSIEQVLRLNED